MALLPRRLFAALLLLAATPARAQQSDDSQVEIKTTHIRGGVYMLLGAGGNMGLSVGEDGAFLIDDQFAPLTERILAAVAEVSEQPVKFLVNTHWHGDHTGGNENLGKRGVLIFAHDNVRERLSKDQVMEAFDRNVKAAPEAARPVVTFSRDLTFHWNGDVIHLFHVDHAHTDGDSIIHFKKANVIHTGDCFFNGMYPFIDPSSGGEIGGVIAATEKILAITDSDTRIIPGHGPLAGTTELQEFHDMLVVVNDRIRKLLAEGKTRDEIVAARPTLDLDEKWGGGFMQPDRWVGIVVDGIQRAPNSDIR